MFPITSMKNRNRTRIRNSRFSPISNVYTSSKVLRRLVNMGTKLCPRAALQMTVSDCVDKSATSYRAASSNSSRAELCGLRTHRIANADPQNFLDPQIDGGSLAEEISGRGLTRILFPDECNIFWWAALSAKALSKPWLISVFYSHTRLLSSCMPLFL